MPERDYVAADAAATVAAPARLTVRDLHSTHAGPFSLELAPGECLAVLGQSGSGKSVLLRMIADLTPCEGGVFLDGTARSHWSGPAWRAQVVYQAAEPAWWEPTAHAHLSAPQAVLAESILAALQLAPASLHAELANQSTGERQRLALIRSLCCRPKVLLLDEPAAALDTASTLALEAVLHSALAEGVAIILVTHSEQQAGRLASRSLRMVQGRLEAT